VTGLLFSERPLCSEAAAARDEPLAATASRIRHWLLVEYGGYWPYEPLDAAVFAGGLREHLEAQLAALPYARLLLIKRPHRDRRDRVRVVFGSTPERGRRFFTLELDGHPDLAELDFAAALGGGPTLGEPLDEPLLLVCTHGKRDRCCARYGRALLLALDRAADPRWVWGVSHIGGDRFAGNLVCLPEGLYFGRLGRKDVVPLLSQYLAGRIDLEHYRGSSCYPFPVQAAEAHVRRATGLAGFHDLRLLGSRRLEPGRWRVELLAEVAGDVHVLEVAVELADREEFLTCRAEEKRRARYFVVRAHDVTER
jgi:hypothetical protein